MAESINTKHREVVALGRTAKEIAAEIGEMLIEVKRGLAHGLSLRVVQIDGEPWFFANDACRALGMDMSAGTSRWTVNVAKDEKRVLTKKTHPQLFCGTTWHTTMLSESGLYKLITRSDKPEAKPSQEWLTRDVLPSIGKTGSYSMTDGAEPRNAA